MVATDNAAARGTAVLVLVGLLLYPRIFRRRILGSGIRAGGVWCLRGYHLGTGLAGGVGAIRDSFRYREAGG